jgi:dTDP-4-dehydrorhamnose reductase
MTTLRAAVLGSGGTLGTALLAQLPRAGMEIVAARAGRGDGDITDAAAMRALLEAARPDVVFNAAAYTNVDRAEDEPAVARAVNAGGAENVARACAAVGARLVHYSTDFVFDGELERPYTEDDAPAPQAVYAVTKLEGERLALAAWPQTAVVRVGCLYGRNGRNFPSTLLRRLRAGEAIRADGERRVSPTWVGAVAVASAALAATRHTGVFHGTSNGETTWADYALFLADAIGAPRTLVQAMPSSALVLKAARPRRAILENRRLAQLGLDTLGTWQEQALAYIASEPR